MNATSSSTERLHTAIQDVLHHPVKLRVALTAGFLLLWYVSLEMPLAKRIGKMSQQVEQERTRLEAIKAVNQLQVEKARFQDRLFDLGDRNALAQYVMEQVRLENLHMVTLSPAAPLEAGTYATQVLTATVQGPYGSLERFVRRLETGPKIVRIDALEIDSYEAQESAGNIRAPGYHEATLTVVGVVGTDA